MPYRCYAAKTRIKYSERQRLIIERSTLNCQSNPPEMQLDTMQTRQVTKDTTAEKISKYLPHLEVKNFSTYKRKVTRFSKSSTSDFPSYHLNIAIITLLFIQITQDLRFILYIINMHQQTKSELRKFSQLQIKNSPNEGESQIKMVYCIRQSTIKFILYVLFCMLSFGIGWIIAFWLPRYKRKFLYSYSTIEQCTHFLVLNWDLEYTIVPKMAVFVETCSGTFLPHAGFENRYLKYYYEEASNAVQVNDFPIEFHLQKEKANKQLVGIQTDQLHQFAQKAYGSCELNITVPHTLQIITSEFLHPFFLFQLYSIILWFYEGYVYFTTVLFFMTLYALIFDVILARENFLKIRKMAFYRSQVYEYASYDPTGPFRRTDTRSLVPGTIIYVRENFQLPCDCILLQGECLVDEATLTGESTPVPKIKSLYNDFNKKNILFDGTTILQVTYSDDQGVPCLVIRTGFQSLRGQLIRSILYPKPHKFNFFQESVHFMLILFAVAIIGILVLIPILIKTDQFNLREIIMTFSDSFTITIPPTLPAAMSFGVSFALDRLRRKGVYCISPPKIIMSGRIDTVCFDKTGTLTHSGMAIKNIVSENMDQIFDCILCCQTLLKVRKEIQIKVRNDKNLEEAHVLGDPMERSLLEFVKGNIISQSGPYLQEVERKETRFGIIKRFDFNSDKQNMSVIARRLQDGQIYLFVKGAPEALKFKHVPAEYLSIQEQETKLGSRVIAFGRKSLDSKNLQEDRSYYEQDLEFLGYCFLQNYLKEESASTVEQLVQANIKVKMVTGDNLNTAVSVASQSSFFRKFNRVGIFSIKSPQVVKYSEFESVTEFNLNKEQHSLEIPIRNDQVLQFNNYFQTLNLDDFQPTSKGIQFCMIGKVFELMFPLSIILNDQHTSLLQNTIVFARMKPHQKTLLIELLQQNKNTVCMVGDGTNDSGAMKQADAGLALTESEASISAPFTSKLMNISSVLILIRNGRAALATNFQCFKFMALYSLIQFVQMIVLYFTFSQMSDMQYLYVDLFIICPIFMTMALTEPYEQLSVQRPASSLFRAQCLISLFGQIFMQTASQVILIIILTKQDFYNGIDKNLELFEDEENFIIKSPDTTSLFLLCNFLYVASIMAFSIAKPFRKPFYSNIYFTINILIIWALNILIAFVKWVRLPNLQFDDNTPVGWLAFVVIYAHLWSAAFYIYEHVVCVKIFLWCQRKKQSQFQEIL